MLVRALRRAAAGQATRRDFDVVQRVLGESSKGATNRGDLVERAGCRYGAALQRAVANGSLLRPTLEAFLGILHAGSLREDSTLGLVFVPNPKAGTGIVRTAQRAVNIALEPPS